MGLLDATSGADADLLLRYRECHLLVLKALQDGRAYGSPWCNKQITRSVAILEEYLWNCLLTYMALFMFKYTEFLIITSENCLMFYFYSFWFLRWIQKTGTLFGEIKYGWFVLNNVLNGIFCLRGFESKTCVLTLGCLFYFITGSFES